MIVFPRDGSMSITEYFEAQQAAQLNKMGDAATSLLQTMASVPGIGYCIAFRLPGADEYSYKMPGEEAVRQLVNEGLVWATPAVRDNTLYYIMTETGFMAAGQAKAFKRAEAPRPPMRPVLCAPAQAWEVCGHDEFDVQIGAGDGPCGKLRLTPFRPDADSIEIVYWHNATGRNEMLLTMRVYEKFGPGDPTGVRRALDAAYETADHHLRKIVMPRLVSAS